MTPPPRRIASPARVASDGRFLVFVDEGTFAPRAHVTCLSLDLQPLGQWELQPNEDLRTQPGFNRNYTTRGPVALELSTHGEDWPRSHRDLAEISSSRSSRDLPIPRVRLFRHAAAASRGRVRFLAACSEPSRTLPAGGGTLWACYRSAHRIAAFDAAEMCARGGRTGVSAAGKPRVGTAPARFSFGGNDEEGTIPPFPADEWRDRAEIEPRSSRDQAEIDPRSSRDGALPTADESGAACDGVARLWDTSTTRQRHVHDTSETRPRQSESTTVRDLSEACRVGTAV